MNGLLLAENRSNDKLHGGDTVNIENGRQKQEQTRKEALDKCFLESKKNGLAGNRTPDHPHAKGVLYH